MRSKFRRIQSMSLQPMRRQDQQAPWQLTRAANHQFLYLLFIVQWLQNILLVTPVHTLWRKFSLILIISQILWFPIFLGLPCFVLRSRISQFWRHQRGSPRWYLATIEAIHQLLIDYQAALKLHLNKEKTKSEDSGQPGLTVTDSTLNRVSCDDSLVYDNAYDDLLFFFRFMYEKIHQLYDHESLRSYKRPLT